jgi:hypothetical protein
VKAGAAKPRVFASSEGAALGRHAGSKIAELPHGGSAFDLLTLGAESGYVRSLARLRTALGLCFPGRYGCSRLQ